MGFGQNLSKIKLKGDLGFYIFHISMPACCRDVFTPCEVENVWIQSFDLGLLYQEPMTKSEDAKWYTLINHWYATSLLYRKACCIIYHRLPLLHTRLHVQLRSQWPIHSRYGHGISHSEASNVTAGRRLDGEFPVLGYYLGLKLALFFRIPDIMFTLLALGWLDVTGCWKVLFGQCQAAPTRSQWRASEELEVSQLCRRQRLSMAE